MEHVIPEQVFTYVNLLPKIFGRKNKFEYNSDFCLNFSMISVWSNMSDTIGYLHQTLQTRRNL
jgi:hypothetical protein